MAHKSPPPRHPREHRSPGSPSKCESPGAASVVLVSVVPAGYQGLQGSLKVPVDERDPPGTGGYQGTAASPGHPQRQSSLDTPFVSQGRLPSHWGAHSPAVCCSVPLGVGGWGESLQQQVLPPTSTRLSYVNNPAPNPLRAAKSWV